MLTEENAPTSTRTDAQRTVPSAQHSALTPLPPSALTSYTPLPRPNVVVFDIEASHLKANIGRVLCFGWQRLTDEKASVVAMSDFTTWVDDPTNDVYVVARAYEVLSAADLVVAHYGKRFDWPFIQTRLLVHGLPALPQVPMVDTWRVAKDYLSLHSNRLASLTQLLSLPSKTEILWDDWARASAGGRHGARAMESIREHCRVDVEVLKQAYLKLRKVIPNHPNLAALVRTGTGEPCPACTGTTQVTRNGTRVSVRRLHQRWVCKSCGNSWTTAFNPKSTLSALPFTPQALGD